ncbi:fatty acid desaturase 4, chloroplastic-like [Pyrus communis]|uniref:fatty acid desaturase 4, chloroplastic-like n=1 Tax=Pyrus communis TaxID=23211 RepID=UPI0035C066CA
MAILTQTKFLPSPINQLHTSHSPILRTSVHCSASTTKANPAPEKLVLKPPLQLLEPSPSPSPALLTDTTIRPPQPNDPSLLSTWSHRAWVASGCTTVLVSLAKSVTCAADSHIWLEPFLAGLVGYVLADLGSGVYHWGIDNYGGASTPIFGPQIEAFQGHHKWPWTITRRQFANNLHALARVVTFFVLPIDLVCDDPVVNGFVAVCSGSIMFSQQFHAWAHGTKSRLPPVVVALQDLGVLVSRPQHAAHHRQPYNNNYCIVSGVWNELLDQQKVFEALEMVLFFKLGLRPRSWSEPSSEWIEETETASQLQGQ